MRTSLTSFPFVHDRVFYIIHSIVLILSFFMASVVFWNFNGCFLLHYNVTLYNIVVDADFSSVQRKKHCTNSRRVSFFSHCIVFYCFGFIYCSWCLFKQLNACPLPLPVSHTRSIGVKILCIAFDAHTHTDTENEGATTITTTWKQ